MTMQLWSNLYGLFFGSLSSWWLCRNKNFSGSAVCKTSRPAACLDPEIREKASSLSHQQKNKNKVLTSGFQRVCVPECSSLLPFDWLIWLKSAASKHKVTSGQAATVQEVNFRIVHHSKLFSAPPPHSSPSPHIPRYSHTYARIKELKKMMGSVWRHSSGLTKRILAHRWWADDR